MSGASIPYLLGAEIPTSAVREKTQAVGASWNVIWAFVTNFVIPYMIDNIHFKVGWVFGSISVLALVFTIFFLPETKVNLLYTEKKRLLNHFHRVGRLKRLMQFLQFHITLFVGPRCQATVPSLRRKSPMRKSLRRMNLVEQTFILSRIVRWHFITSKE